MRSRLARFYAVVGLVILGAWGVATQAGWEWGTPTRQFIPADVRSQPGGYRSFHFWHVGYYGGK
jgi:hypothetical protein